MVPEVFSWFNLVLFMMISSLVTTTGCQRKSLLSSHYNPQIEQHVQKLLDQMTLEEKINLLSGTGMSSRPNHRLGIPELRMTDGPLGPNGKGQATNYSACIAMAATWDETLIQRVGEVIGKETRSLGYHMLLGPCLNIARVPHGGRTFESFGEDPYLTSRIAVAYIKGVQSQGIITCAKHFACNNQEWNRFDVDVRVDERTLHEIYLPAFKAAVQEAGASSIMASYNQVNGTYACENKYLLTDILKNEWGFTGFVVSDWGGIKSTVTTANAGLDLEMPVEKYLGKELLTAVNNVAVAKSGIDDKVRRILRVIIKSGLFDNSEVMDNEEVDTREHRELALEVAQKGIVLLKNENHILPLMRKQIKSIAVLGPNADEARLYGGGSGRLDSFYKISLLEGLQNKVGDKIILQFARGVGNKRSQLSVVDSSALILPHTTTNEPGLKAEYFNNRELQGEPILTRIDKQINVNWKRESPAPGIVNPDQFSVRWTGQLIAPGTGQYEIGLNADNGVRLYLDGKLIVDSWTDAAPDQLKSGYIDLIAGQHYDLRVEFYENLGDAMVQLGMEPVSHSNRELEQAVMIAKSSDVAIIGVGLDQNMEGEAHDREKLDLPEDQVVLIKAVANVNKNTIVVLNNATPILMNEWIGQVAAIIEAWYPGQEGGTALADILFGDINPSGKLPLTFLKLWQDSPVYQTYPGTKEIARYSEGIYVGYRHFDKHRIEPLFPFGYGLSYTRFEYSNLTITPGTISQDEIVKVKVTIKNIGKVAGDEVVQLYVRDVEASADRPIKELKGFKRVTLTPHEKQTLTFKLDRKALAFYNADLKKWVAEPGQFEVLIGSSSLDIRVKGVFELR